VIELPEIVLCTEGDGEPDGGSDPRGGSLECEPGPDVRPAVTPTPFARLIEAACPLSDALLAEENSFTLAATQTTRAAATQAARSAVARLLGGVLCRARDDRLCFGINAI
jgi:hypothetical protein